MQRMQAMQYTLKEYLVQLYLRPLKWLLGKGERSYYVQIVQIQWTKYFLILLSINIQNMTNPTIVSLVKMKYG